MAETKQQLPVEGVHHTHGVRCWQQLVQYITTSPYLLTETQWPTCRLCWNTASYHCYNNVYRCVNCPSLSATEWPELSHCFCNYYWGLSIFLRLRHYKRFRILVSHQGAFHFFKQQVISKIRIMPNVGTLHSAWCAAKNCPLRIHLECVTSILIFYVAVCWEQALF